MKTKTLGMLIGLAPLFVLTWGATGCGGDHISLSLPDGDVIPWGGSIQVVADIREQGNKPKDGEDVFFSTQVGSFEPYEEGRVTAPVKDIEVETSGGQAIVTLYSFPGEGGASGNLIANYETIGSKSLSEAIPISAAEGGKPAGDKLSAQCDAVNVTALKDNGEPADTDMKIRCTVSVKDNNDDPVPVASIRAEVEGGCQIKEIVEDNSGATHVFTLTADCVPMDVEPWDGEPNHMYAGRIYNPRDGILTIMFAAEGQEGFVDSNNNNTYDPGEGFVGKDLAEPFLDVNDNGEWDAGEVFIDNNDNGQWDPADGRWSDDVYVSTTTHIMFTGPPHQSAETTHFEPAGINIPDAGNVTLAYFLVDQNHNPIAANNASDQIDFNPEDLTVEEGETQALLHEMGAVFQDGVLNPESLSRDTPSRRFSVRVADRHPGDENPYPVSLQPRLRYTTAPSYDGYSGQRLDIDLNPISGTAN